MARLRQGTVCIHADAEWIGLSTPYHLELLLACTYYYGLAGYPRPRSGSLLYYALSHPLIAQCHMYPLHNCHHTFRPPARPPSMAGTSPLQCRVYRHYHSVENVYLTHPYQSKLIVPNHYPAVSAGWPTATAAGDYRSYYLMQLVDIYP